MDNITTKQVLMSCPMCMHAGSLLQKNAPIFGNVFTVTLHTRYTLVTYF